MYTENDGLFEKHMFLPKYGYFLGVLTVDGSEVWGTPVKVGRKITTKENIMTFPVCILLSFDLFSLSWFYHRIIDMFY